MNRNRTESAVNIIARLAKMMVADQDSIEIKTTKAGPVSFISVTCRNEDMGRLIGKGGATFRAINSLARALAGHDKIEVQVTEPSEVNSPSPNLFSPEALRQIMAEIVATIFGDGHAVELKEVGGSILITASLTTAWDTDPVAGVAKATRPKTELAANTEAVLTILFTAIGRAHGSTVRLWITTEAMA